MVNRQPSGTREGGRFASSTEGKENVPTASIENLKVEPNAHAKDEKRNTSLDEMYAKFQGYIPVFRGLEDITKAKDITFEGLGVHWTTDPDTALKMAVPEWAIDDEEIEGSISGLVIHALVHPDHIMKLGTPEMEGWEQWRMDEEHWEAEQTIRPGSPIQIIKIEKVSHNKETGVLSERALTQGVPNEGIA